MIDRAPFGSTGHDSTRTIFGGAALGSVAKSDADRALDTLLAHGINHIDVAASYGDAELRVASWLKRHPDTFFVATKTGERTYRAARDEIHRSLDRLGVDRIDSIQLHNLVDVIEWETALGPGGALEAAPVVQPYLSQPGVFHLAGKQGALAYQSLRNDGVMPAAQIAREASQQRLSMLLFIVLLLVGAILVGLSAAAARRRRPA